MNKRRSSALAALAVVWVLGLATVAAALPGGVPARTAVAQGIGQASYGGVSFSYESSLADNVRGETIPGNVGQGVLVSEERPEHIRFSFDGYPSKGLWSPQIRVIPLAAYKSAHPQSAISAELSGLQGYLGGETGGPLPSLPPVNAQRFINENVAPVAGAGVSGVRFIAAYAQAILPVSADNITYIFTGLTADRNYYVEGTFPVSLTTPLAPAPSPITIENAQAYNRAVAEQLSKTDASGFTPSLEKLDKMMASIQVNASAIPGMPRTGAGTYRYEGVVFVMLALATITILVGLAASRRTRAFRVR